MPILYILLLAAQVVTLIFAIRRKASGYWIALLALEALSAVLAWGLGVWYDGLPGYGIMPGLTYFAEAIYSYGAVILFVGMTVISAILWIFYGRKK